MFRRLLPCLLAFALLIPTLTSQSIWWDEGISLHLAGLPWREIVAERAANIHPPLYFLLLKAWVALTGSTPFAARYLSALMITLLPALVARFLGRRIGRRAAGAGGLLAALAPPFLIYGQEVRAYALLLLWTLALWSLVWLPPDGDARRDRRAGVWRGLLLGLVQAGLLLTHYAGVIAVGVATVGLFQEALDARRKGRIAQAGRAWLIGAGVTALLLLPWGVVLGIVGLGGLERQAGLGNVLASAVPAGYVARLIGIFHLVGLPAALDDPLLSRPAALTGVLLVLAAADASVNADRRRPVIALLALWLGPLLSVPVIWALSPQSHPRYIFPFVLGGWLLGATLVGVPRAKRGAVQMHMLPLALLAGALVTTILGAHAYLTNPAYARSDIRGVAAAIREQARAGDIVIAPDTDWSLAQYDLGVAQLVMASDYASASSPVLPVTESTGTDFRRRVFALDYGRGALDPGGALRAMLTWHGVLTERRSYHGVLLETYELDGAHLEMSACEPLPRQCVAGTGLCLTGAAFRDRPISGAALPVRLCWEATPVATRYAVALRLYAPSGALVAAVSDLLLDVERKPTDMWATGPISSYHLIPLPVGLLPDSYRLEAGVFAHAAPDVAVSLVGAEGAPRPAILLGDVVPAATPWRDTSSYGLEVPVPPITVLSSQPGLDLGVEGAAVDRARAAPGERVFVTLRGHATGAEGAASAPVLHLRQGGQWLDVADVADRLQTLPAGRPFLVHAALSVPATAESGPAQVVLQSGERDLILGELAIDAAAHLFNAPPVAYEVEAAAGDVATLVGFEVAPDAPLQAGAPVTLTLVWRAGPGAAARDLKVFTHLVVGDTIVAQHDANPANWARPTTGWIRDEIVIDVHDLAWQRLDLEGAATLRVGLYDGETNERVPWAVGGDAYTLLLPVQVVPEE